MKGSGWLVGLVMLGFSGAAHGQTNAPTGQPSDAPAQAQEPKGENADQGAKSDAAVGAPPAPAKEKPAAPSSGTSFAANQVSGRINKVDRSSKQLTIDQAGQPQELKISENVTVFINGRLGSVEDLREGQQVRAAYEERAGQKSLRWIEVRPEGKSSTEKQEPSREDGSRGGDVADPATPAPKGDAAAPSAPVEEEKPAAPKE